MQTGLSRNWPCPFWEQSFCIKQDIALLVLGWKASKSPRYNSIPMLQKVYNVAPPPSLQAQGKHPCCTFPHGRKPVSFVHFSWAQEAKW